MSNGGYGGGGGIIGRVPSQQTRIDEGEEAVLLWQAAGGVFLAMSIISIVLHVLVNAMVTGDDWWSFVKFFIVAYTLPIYIVIARIFYARGWDDDFQWIPTRNPEKNYQLVHGVLAAGFLSLLVWELAETQEFWIWTWTNLFEYVQIVTLPFSAFLAMSVLTYRFVWEMADRHHAAIEIEVAKIAAASKLEILRLEHDLREEFAPTIIDQPLEAPRRPVITNSSRKQEGVALADGSGALKPSSDPEAGDQAYIIEAVWFGLHLITNNLGMTEADWHKRHKHVLPTGRILSRDDGKEYRNFFIRVGLAGWNDINKHNDGWHFVVDQARFEEYFRGRTSRAEVEKSTYIADDEDAQQEPMI